MVNGMNWFLYDVYWSQALINGSERVVFENYLVYVRDLDSGRGLLELVDHKDPDVCSAARCVCWVVKHPVCTLRVLTTECGDTQAIQDSVR